MDRGPTFDAPPRLAEVLTDIPAEPVVREEGPLFGGARARRLRKLRRVGAVSSILIALVLVAGTVFVVTQRNVTTTVSLNDAVGRFRAAAPERPQEGHAVAQRTTVVAEEADEQEAIVVTDTKAGAKAAAKSGPYVLPTDGVYTYRATGGERVSMFNAKHEYPDRVFATVRHLGGCKWEHQMQVLEEHLDRRHLCGREGSATQLMQERQVTFFGTTEGAALKCEPAMLLHRVGEKAGTTTESSCADDEGNKGVMKRTFVGIETIKIGTESVRAVRVDISSTTSGMAVGSSFDAVWLHPETGMTLRWERTVDTIAKAFGAKVRYQEDASFVLESLDPQR